MRKDRRHIARSALLTLLVFSALVCAPCVAQAQSPPPKGWTQLSTHTTMDGLPSNSVYSLLYEPQTGTLLMGTEKGLYRFDGTDYRYIIGSKHPYTMLDNLSRDSEGVIWCQDYRGNAYQLLGDRLVARPIEGLGRFKKITIDAENHIWALCTSGVARWLPKQTAWKRYPIAAHSFKSTLQLEVLSDSIILNNRRDHLQVFRPNSKAYNSQAIALPDRDHDFIVAKGQMYIWKRVGGPFFRWLPNGETQPVAGWENQIVANVSEFRTTPGFGHWISTNIGLFRATNDDTWEQFTDAWVTDVALDEEGTLWLSTRDQGIMRFVQNGIRHIPVYADIHRIAILKGGTLRLGAAKGKVITLDRKGQTIETNQWPLAYEVENLYADSTRGIYAEHRDVYIGGQKRFEFNNTGSSLPPRIWDARKELIIARYYPGFALYPLSDNVPIPLPSWNTTYQKRYGFLVHDPLRDIRMTDMLIADDGQALLLVCEAGLIRTSAERIDTLRLPTGERFLPRQVCRLGHNHYLVATYNHGLWLMDDRRLIRELRALNDDPLKVMQMTTANGRAILLLKQGIMSFSVSGGFSRALSHNDGLLKSDIKTMQMDLNGVWLATTEGLTFVPYMAFDQTLTYQPIELLGIKKDGVAYAQNTLDALPYDLSSLSFNVHRTSLRFANQQELSYRLKNQSTQWQRLPADETEVTLLGLKPGTYELAIRSQMLGNPASVDDLHLTFTILPAWWATWWFWVLSLLSILLIGLLVYVTRVQRIRAKAALQTKVSEAELSALRAQMNPHFMFNALNSLQAAIIKTDTLRAMRLLKTFASLLRTTVDYARSHSIPLRVEIEQIERYMELQQSRFSEQVFIALQLPQKHLSRRVPAMFIMPFIENAFEHGLRHKRKGDKHLRIEMEWLPDDRLRVIIEDNGIGRAAAQATKDRQNLHQSVGLLSVRERLALYNQPGRAKIELDIVDLQTNTREAAGTRIELILPSTHESLEQN